LIFLDIFIIYLDIKKAFTIQTSAPEFIAFIQPFLLGGPVISIHLFCNSFGTGATFQSASLKAFVSGGKPFIYNKYIHKKINICVFIKKKADFIKKLPV